MYLYQTEYFLTHFVIFFHKVGAWTNVEENVTNNHSTRKIISISVIRTTVHKSIAEGSNLLPSFINHTGKTVNHVAGFRAENMDSATYRGFLPYATFGT